jgi:hypothetical protein
MLPKDLEIASFTLIFAVANTQRLSGIGQSAFALGQNPEGTKATR